MSPGRNKKVMIACVLFETTKVCEPAQYYDVDEIHLIHGVCESNNEAGQMCGQFYNRVCEILKKNNPGIVIWEHRLDVNDFTSLLKKILNVISESKDTAEIYVNLSSGTPEYIAAATTASMMSPGTISFTVPTISYTTNSVLLKSVIFDNSVPIGISKEVSDPVPLPIYEVLKPKEHLVLGLRILRERIQSKQPTSAKYMIRAFKDGGIWFRGNSSSQTEAVYYHRDYVAVWLDAGWTVKDEIYRSKLLLTSDGERIADTFYLK